MFLICLTYLQMLISKLLKYHCINTLGSYIFEAIFIFIYNKDKTEVLIYDSGKKPTEYHKRGLKMNTANMVPEIYSLE